MSGNRRIVVGRVSQNTKIRGKALADALGRELVNEMDEGSSTKKKNGKHYR